MEKLSFTQLFYLLFIAVALWCVATGLSAWTAPSGSAPADNVVAPFNIGSSAQIKAGGIGLDTLAVYGVGYIQTKLGIGRASPVVAVDVNGSMRVGNGGEACTSSIEGSIRYNTDANELEYCDGSQWRSVSSGQLSGYYASCKAILDDGASVGSGTYTIDPDGTGGESSFDVECDMTTAGGGWTQIVQSAPSYNHPGWSESDGYQTITDTTYISKAWHVLTSVEEVMDGTRGADISSCWSNKSLSQILDLGTATCSASSVSGLSSWSNFMVAPSQSYNGCGPLRAKIAYQFNTWDGGVSGAYNGLSINGYKTNNSTMCSSQCVFYSSSCRPADYEAGGNSLWVR